MPQANLTCPTPAVPGLAENFLWAAVMSGVTCSSPRWLMQEGVCLEGPLTNSASRPVICQRTHSSHHMGHVGAENLAADPLRLEMGLSNLNLAVLICSSQTWWT